MDNNGLLSGQPFLWVAECMIFFEGLGVGSTPYAGHQHWHVLTVFMQCWVQAGACPAHGVWLCKRHMVACVARLHAVGTAQTANFGRQLGISDLSAMTYEHVSQRRT